MTALSIFTSADVGGSRRAVGDSFPEEGPPRCVQGIQEGGGEGSGQRSIECRGVFGLLQTQPISPGVRGETEKEREARDAAEREDLCYP